MYKGYAQIPKPPTTVQSPNVASLGIFGEVPVSLANGLPQINIPLCEWKEGNIRVPVSLNYHASGFRPDMHPGWVGMGWALEAGGTISRIVKDQPDDYNNPKLTDGAYNGFYWNSAVLSPNNWSTLTYMKSIAYKSDEFLKDTEPDQFSFSYPGGNGTFYRDAAATDGRKWKVKCDKPVVVTFNGEFLDVPFYAPNFTQMQVYGNTPSFSGFTVTDENGNQYIYGGNTSAIEYSISFFYQDFGAWIAQAWHLTKIIQADGYEVSFNYERDDFINQMYVAISMDLGTGTVISGSVLNPLPSCYTIEYSNNEKYFIEGELVAPSYLKSIQGTNGRIVFDRSTSTELRYPNIAYENKYTLFKLYGGYMPELTSFLPILSMGEEGNIPADIINKKLNWKKLDKIRIEDEAGRTKRAFSLSYNNIATERLMLKSLVETGANEEAKAPYQFSYNEYSKPLPGYLVCRTDHWGFFNDTYADFSDKYTWKNTYYGFREPKAEALLAGTLNKIEYPTGGVTEFVFEPHHYSKRLKYNRTEGLDPDFNANTLAGGLRIKKVSSYDILDPTAKQEKEYFYVNGFSNGIDENTLSSSGILGGQIKYYFDDYRSTAFNDDNVVYYKAEFSSQSVLPASENSVGSHVGYSEVTEKLSDGSYTRYFFTNFDTRVDEAAPCIQLTRTPYEPVSALTSEKGVLLKQEMYSTNNMLVKKKELEYQALNKSKEFARALKTDFFNVCPGTAVSVGEGVAYKLYTYSYVPKAEITTEYDDYGQNPMTTRVEFIYNNTYRQLSEKSETDSKSQLKKTYYRYPYDVLGYTPSGNADVNQTTAYMVNHNMVGWPVEIINTKTVDGTEQVTGSDLITYQSFSGIIKPAFEFKFTNPVPIAKSNYVDYTVTGFNGSNEIITKDSRLSPFAEFLAYDRHGNITSYKQSNDKRFSFIWDYNKNLNTAIVADAKENQIAYTSFETEDLGGWEPAVGSSYLTNNGNITGVRSFSGRLNTAVPDGNYIVTLWGQAGGSQTVNGQEGSIIATSGSNILKQWKLSNPSTITVIGDNIDDVRLYPETAQMTTYTYDPLVDVTSKSDENNQISYYLYDGLGRMTMVRDREKNLLRKIIYSYRSKPNVTYYSSYKGGAFTKECFGVGSSVWYEVPAGAYTSVISQQEAEEIASKDLDLNGPLNANQHGTCDDSFQDLTYVTALTGVITLKFENTYTHKTYDFSITSPSTTSPAVFGSLPKGWYNVTVNVPGTGVHRVGIGQNWQDSSGAVKFTNIKMHSWLDYMVLINW